MAQQWAAEHVRAATQPVGYCPQLYRFPLPVSAPLPNARKLTATSHAAQQGHSPPWCIFSASCLPTEAGVLPPLEADWGVAA